MQTDEGCKGGIIMNNSNIWALNKDGEIVDCTMYRNNKIRFKADTPFDNSIIPYIIMLFCAAVDGVVFYSLFSRISYDSPIDRKSVV